MKFYSRDSLNSMATWKGGTALHYSAENGDVEACRILLETKADPALRNALGQTPLDAARFVHRAPAPIEELFGSWFD